MRLLTWTLLVGMAVLSLTIGRIDIALGLAGAKSLLVGLDFMELRHAAVAHLASYALFVVALVGGLVVLT